MGEAAVKVAAGLRLRQRRHRRVPLPGRRVLLPRDEHPAAGGAPGHRAGHRPRPRRAGSSRIAAGEPLGFTQDDVAAQRPRHRGPHQRRGPGRRARSRPRRAPSPASAPPAGPGVRLDAGYEAGDTVSQFYDNLIAKLIVWGHDREAARRRHAAGPRRDASSRASPPPSPPTSPSSRTPTSSPATHSTKWVEDDARPEPVWRPGRRTPPPAADADDERCPRVQRDVTAEVDGRRYQVKLWVPDLGDAAVAAVGRRGPRAGPKRPQGRGRRRAGSGTVAVPMQGTIVKVLVGRGRRRRGRPDRLRPRGHEDGERRQRREGRRRSRRSGSRPGDSVGRRRRRRGHRVAGAVDHGATDRRQGRGTGGDR